MGEQTIFDPEKFLFRDLHPLVSIGTASDRYKGWVGQIYSQDLYAGRIKARTNRVGKNSFRDEILPIDCVREYFQHFRILEIDYTFYAPLVEKRIPTPCAGTLGQYAMFLGTGDGVFLKAPQVFFAQKLRRGKDYIRNENYLAPEPFFRQFYEPALGILGDNLRGIIFEQEYQRFGDRPPPEALAADFDRFFAAIPSDTRYHVELRTEAYLCKPVFEVLRKYGVGQVLSHWTWLPNLSRQFLRSGRRFVDAGGQVVLRLMTPLCTRYEDAYAKAFPFDRLIDGMVQPAMIDQTAHLMWEAILHGTRINIIINNRAGGNAPLIARMIAARFLEIGGKSPNRPVSG